MASAASSPPNSSPAISAMPPCPSITWPARPPCSPPCAKPSTPRVWTTTISAPRNFPAISPARAIAAPGLACEAVAKQARHLHSMLKMYTTTWCPDCRRAKRFLADHGIAFEEINIEQTPGAAALVAASNQGKYKVPTLSTDDGHTFACSPFYPAILRRELNLN